MNDAQLRCSACLVLYSEPHAEGCAVERAREIACREQLARHAAKACERGEKIDEGEDGIYAIDDADPVIVAYNEGGYNSTGVRVSVILDWLRKRRPDLLTAGDILTVPFRDEKIYVSVSTVWTLADEILRLEPARHCCHRCGLPLVLGDEMDEPMMQCPGLCDVSESISHVSR